MLIAAGMDNWNAWKLMPQLLTIIVTTVLIVSVSFIYSRKAKKMKADDDPRGIVLLVELIVKYIENMVVEVLGVKYKNLTIYLMYLILYILIGNWVSIIGLESQASSYTVTLSLALVTFVGIYYIGIKFQKWVFFKKYINPLEIITQFAPLISLSFRLFGNIMGGAIILTLLYGFTGQLWAKIPVIGQANFLIGGIAPFLHMYFDLFTGSIQALIFGILTIVYWKLEMVTDQKSDVEVKLPRKYRKKRKQSHLTELLENEREIFHRAFKEKK